jgi:amino acid permease
MTMVTGSGLLSVSIGLNAVSSHGACTAVFVAVSAILVFILASIPTLGKISILGWIGLISILSAIFTLTIAVGVQSRPEAAPTTGNWLDEKEVNIVGSPSFYGAITAISSLVFSYAGTPAFFGVVSEMRDPKRYTRSLIFCQSIVTAVYLVRSSSTSTPSGSLTYLTFPRQAIGIVVYFYCGQFVSSPALGSAGELLKKVRASLPSAFPPSQLTLSRTVSLFSSCRSATESPFRASS